jgi:hypothetical protein
VIVLCIYFDKQMTKHQWNVGPNGKRQ